MNDNAMIPQQQADLAGSTVPPIVPLDAEKRRAPAVYSFDLAAL
jgi:hypothetical protein